MEFWTKKKNITVKNIIDGLKTELKSKKKINYKDIDHIGYFFQPYREFFSMSLFRFKKKKYI